MAKRPAKQTTINFIMSQYSFLSMGMQGVTLELIAEMIKTGSYYLYEAEVKEILAKEMDKDPEFDAELFVKMLKAADAIKEGATPRITDNLVRVNSKERALEVANDPSNEADVNKIVDVMTQMVELRDTLKLLIDKKASCSIALKNKKSAKKSDDSGDDSE